MSLGDIVSKVGRGLKAVGRDAVVGAASVAMAYGGVAKGETIYVDRASWSVAEFRGLVDSNPDTVGKDGLTIPLDQGYSTTVFVSGGRFVLPMSQPMPGASYEFGIEGLTVKGEGYDDPDTPEVEGTILEGASRNSSIVARVSARDIKIQDLEIRTGSVGIFTDVSLADNSGYWGIVYTGLRTSDLGQHYAYPQDFASTIRTQGDILITNPVMVGDPENMSSTGAHYDEGNQATTALIRHADLEQGVAYYMALVSDSPIMNEGGTISLLGRIDDFVLIGGGSVQEAVFPPMRSEYYVDVVGILEGGVVEERSVVLHGFTSEGTNIYTDEASALTALSSVDPVTFRPLRGSEFLQKTVVMSNGRVAFDKGARGVPPIRGDFNNDGVVTLEDWAFTTPGGQPDGMKANILGPGVDVGQANYIGDFGGSTITSADGMFMTEGFDGSIDLRDVVAFQRTVGSQ